MPLADYITERSVAAAALVLAILSAVAGGGYAIGLKQGENNLKEVEDFKKTLPSMMENLTKLSADIAQTTEMSDENKKLKLQQTASSAQIEGLQKTIKDQTVELSAAQKKAIDLQTQLDKIIPSDQTEVTVQVGYAKRVIPNILTLGLQSANDSYINATINGHSRIIYVGEYDSTYAGDKVCKSELMQIAVGSATWIVACSKR